jgi:hypothetical protein
MTDPPFQSKATRGPVVPTMQRGIDKPCAASWAECALAHPLPHGRWTISGALERHPKSFRMRTSLAALAVLLAASCMSAPVSKRINLYNSESPTTGPAGVPGSGGTGAAGSLGSGGTFGGTTLEGAHQTPGNETGNEAPGPNVRPASSDGGTAH